MIRRRRKNWWYYCKRLVLLGVIFWGVSGLPKWWHSFGYINTDKILEESVLKNKVFSAKVQQVKSGILSAYLREEHSNPIVSISFGFGKSGSAYVKDNQQGIAALTAEMLTAGAGEFSEEQFSDLLDEYGIVMNFDASADDFIGSVVAPSENLHIAVKLLRAVFSAPRLEDNYLQLAKQQMLTVLKMQNEHPQNILNNRFKKVIYGSHPYSRNSLGRAEDIVRLNADNVRKYMASKFAKDNLVVGIAGDISVNRTERLLVEVFGGLPEKSETAELPEIKLQTEGKIYDIRHHSSQAISRLVAQGTYRDSVDFYPLYVANYIFGESGLSSRLSKIIREEKGLTYGVYTYLNMNDKKATIEGGFSATVENFAEARHILQEEWLKLGKNGVSEKELDEAKQSLLTSFNLRFATIDSISNMLVAMQKYNLGIDFLDKRNDYVAKVTLKEVNAAAKKYFNKRPDFVNIGAINSEEE